LKNIAKQIAKNALSAFGLQLTRKTKSQGCTYLWLEEAKQAGMEINDFIEKDQSKQPLAELGALVFPYISPQSVICELGPGTGCYTRRLIDKVPDGEFHVVDYDQYTLDFLKNYFSARPETRFHLNSGYSLPFEKDSWMDLTFATSIFTGVNLTFFGLYIREFMRVLKPGGHCVFDYFDISTSEGWNVYLNNLNTSDPVLPYNFHATETVDKILFSAGFEILQRYPTMRGSTFVIARKPPAN
jgi:ubiquinone/menaquinone biosynthesis C-methylase UbiE